MTHLRLACALWLAAALPAVADVATLTSTRDTSIYGGSGADNADGGGASFIVGTNNNLEARRGLLLFDLSSLPSGAVVQSVSLKLTLVKAPAGDDDRVVTLHRALVSWGENPADDAGTGAGSGSGVPAMLGDATWLTRFFDQGPAWTTPGGDFAPATSASATVTTVNGDFTWTGGSLAGDVQAWLATPTDNHGWLVLGDETVSRTNRQFATREAPAPGSAPTLTITYTVPEPRGASLLLTSALPAVALLARPSRR